jgi:SAM-dependent methyltransferase
MESLDFHDFEQSGWQRAAGRYGDAFGGLTSQTIARLLNAARVERGTRLLDIASGPGYVAAAAAAQGATACGIDFSSEMVRLAAGRYPGIRFLEGDAEALPFPDASFDAATINFGVLHLARPDAALAEARRVLVAGGRCALTVWAKPDVSVGFGIVLRAIETHGRMARRSSDSAIPGKRPAACAPLDSWIRTSNRSPSCGAWNRWMHSTTHSSRAPCAQRRS